MLEYRFRAWDPWKPSRIRNEQNCRRAYASFDFGCWVKDLPTPDKNKGKANRIPHDSFWCVWWFWEDIGGHFRLCFGGYLEGTVWEYVKGILMCFEMSFEGIRSCFQDAFIGSTTRSLKHVILGGSWEWENCITKKGLSFLRLFNRRTKGKCKELLWKYEKIRGSAS